jgi:pimeloyl-ACP methyl ester carboxylesterase
MSTFVLIHGAGDGGWAWHLLVAELEARGHDAVAPDLPSDDDSAGLEEYVQTVVDAVGDKKDLVVVGHSLGGFTAPLVADRLQVDTLVLLAAMIPAPGESFNDWWSNTGYSAAARKQAARDGGLTGNDDPMVGYYHDVAPEIAKEAMRRERDQSNTPLDPPWPLDAWPDVPTKFILAKDDRFFPAEFLRSLAKERLGVTPDEIPGSHCVALGHPKELAEVLDSYTR